METVSAPQEDSSGANPSSVKSEDSSPRASSGRGSPPPNCAICLGTCKNKSFTDSCLHQFCFTCLLTWSKVKAECPLCKQNFKSIIHNVRSNHQYEEYMVEQRQSEEVVERIDIDSFTTATRRFRYRTTLTLPRSDSEAIQQLLLHYPMVNDVLPTRAPPARRRRSPTSFRRTVYRHNLWARPLSDITGRFRNCTPEFYRYNNAQMHRLVPWLNRELHYLLNENAQHISYVMTRILELLPQYHINSVAFRDAISPYFNDRTEHFQHELYCFASTPYDMMGYDRNVQYTTDPRISTMVNEVISSSDSDSVDSDIVMISSSEPAPMPRPAAAATAATTTAAAAAGPSRPTAPSQAPPPYYPPNYIPNPNNSVIPIETISHSDTDDDSSEVIVVGYIKPPQDRTPEVVDLMGSDSDVVVQETPQAGPSQGAEERAPLVKLSLKRYAAADSDSSASAAAARRRRRRLDSQRLYSSTDDDDTSSYYLTESESTFNLGSSSTSLSSSPSPRETKTKKKSSKTKSKRQGTTKKHKSKSKKSHKRKRSRSPAETRRPKKKSRSDKEIKNSKRSARRETPPQPVATAQKQDDEQPSTSGVTKKHKKDSKKKDKKHRRGSAESSSKRLKSVVKVINPASESNSNSNLLNVLSDAILNPNSSVLSYNSDSGSIPCESGRGLPAELRGSVDSCFTSSAGAPASPSSSPSPGPAPASSAAPAASAASASAPADSDTDSEDNIPLNLTIHRT